MSQLSLEQARRLAHYIQMWSLVSAGEPISTRSSLLLPAWYQEVPVMLKIAEVAEERRGNSLMRWYAGNGSAPVLNYAEEAILLERATETATLAQLVGKGYDDTASQILCDVAARLHRPRQQPPPDVIPLSVWFSSLATAADQHGNLFEQAFQTAQSLLIEPQDICVLHGDLHHDNVLHFGSQGWLAIDPKGLLGERTFDFANIFCNPSYAAVKTEGRLVRQIDVVSQVAELTPKRLLQWVLSWAGLSAAWCLEDGDDPIIPYDVMQQAEAALRR